MISKRKFAWLLPLLGACGGEDLPDLDADAGAEAPREMERDGGMQVDSGVVPLVGDDEIQTIIASRCVRCHGPGTGNLDLTAPFRDKVIDVTTDGFGGCFADQPAVLVVPGNRNASYLYQKITGRQSCGGRMPYRPEGPLTSDQIELFGRWIDQLDDGNGS